MKKAGLAVGAAVLVTTMWLAWPSSAPATQAGTDTTPPADLTAATPPTKPRQADAAVPSAGADTLARAALPDGASMLRGRVVDPLGASLADIELELGSTPVEYLSSLEHYLLHHSGNPGWIGARPR